MNKNIIKKLIIAIMFFSQMDLYSQTNSNQVVVGNINQPSGAIYGQMGWENPIDIKTIGEDVFVLAKNNSTSETYLIKYSSGVFISSSIVSSNSMDDYKYVIGDNNYLYLAGNNYTENQNVIISKYDYNLAFVSSVTYSGGGLDLKSITMDSANIYACINSNPGSGNLVRINTISLSTTAIVALPENCEERGLLENSEVLYSLLENSWTLYIAAASVSNLSFSTFSLFSVMPSIPKYVGISSSNLFILSCPSYERCDTYKYDINDFSAFISSETLILFPMLPDTPPSGSFPFAVIDSVISVGYSKYNPVTNKNSFAVNIYSTSDFKLINEFNIETLEENILRKMDMSYGISGSTLYVTGETYFCKNFGCDNDIRTVAIKDIDKITNNPPVLSFPPEFVYEAGVAPSRVVPLGMPVTFYVEYRDFDGDDPNYVKVIINGSNYDMSFVSSDSLTGIMLFSYSTTPLAGVYTFKFEAQDNQGNFALGYPVENENNLIVVKGFYGSFANNDKTVNLEIPNEEFSKKLILSQSGEEIYLLSNNSEGGSFVGKLSSATNIENEMYLPFMEKDEFVIHDMVAQGDGYQILASSRVSENNYEFFTATMTSNFQIVASSTIVSGLQDIQGRFSLYLNNGNRYIFVDGDDSFMVLKCDNTNCTFSNEIKIVEGPASQKKTKLSKGFIDGDLVYVVGYYYKDDSSQSDINGFIGKLKTDLTDFEIVSTFTAPGVISFDRFIDFVKQGGYFYVSGYSNNGVKNYGFILKYDENLQLSDSRLFNIGKSDVVKSILIDNGKIVIAGDTIREENLSQTRSPFLVKFDTVTLDMTSLYFYPFNNQYDIHYQDAKISDSNVYLVTDVKSPIPSYKSDSKIEKKILSDIIGDNQEVNVNVVVKSTNNAGLEDVEIVLVPFESRKVNIGKVKTGYITSSDGSVQLKALKNTTYLVALSTPGYSPTIKQQFMDPYQRFIKTFNDNTTVNYTLSKINTPSNTFKVIVNNIVKGYPVFVSLELVGVKEPVAFGFAKATDTVITVDLYNVPNLESGKYKIDVSVPEILSKNEILYSNFPATYTALANYIVDFLSAGPAGGSYEEQKQQIQPVFTGTIFDTSGNPVLNAQVKISAGNYSEIKYTDANGKFAFYTSTSVIGYTDVDVYINKKGYTSGGAHRWLPLYEWTHSIAPATYTLSGYLTYDGIPLPGIKVKAGGYDNSKFSFGGVDSYKPEGFNKQIRSNSFVITDSSGYFLVEGLTDGNVGLYVDYPVSKFINFGNDEWNSQNDPNDDIRIVISSSGATPPQGNLCTSGKVWILDSSGTCKGISPYTFELAKPIVENATLKLSVKYDVIGSTDTAATILIAEDKPSDDKIKKFVRLPSGLVSGTTSYIIHLTSNTRYYFEIISDKWANRGMFDSFDFTSTDTVSGEIVLTRAGKLKGKVIKPDGSVLMPRCETQGCKWPRIYINSLDKSYNESTDFWVDEYSEPIFEFPNIPAGKYNLSFQMEGYPISSIENVSVEAGKTTEVKFNLMEGLVVQPNITSLPSSTYYYAILAMPSGFEMKWKNINDLLFNEEAGEKYLIGYDKDSLSFENKYLSSGKYDFYLVLASKFNPGDDNEDPQSFRSFINFIGREKNKVIQKDPQNPNYGTVSQPVSDFNLYGSIGKSSLSGKITGKNIFKEGDFNKIFSGNISYLISLIPSIMIYDSAGELRGFAHSIMDSEQSLSNFMSALTAKSTQTIVDVFQSSSSYYIAGLPNGKYTAVFLSPNYPAVTKEITINGSTVYNFDFDSVNISSSLLSGKIVDESSNAIKGVKVYLSHKTFEKTIYTDDNGNYSIDNLPPGLYKMEISKEGYVSDGKKFSIAANDNIKFDFTMKKSQGSIIGKVYLSKFPNTLVSAGVKVIAYNETKNVSGANYISKIETITSDDGSYEIKGIEAGDDYRVVASYPGKLTQTIIVKSTNGVTIADDIVFIDIPPQIDVKLKKDKSLLEVNIKSPKELLSTPICEYVIGKYNQDNFNEDNAVQLALVKGPANTYIGRFNISKLQPYYTIRVTAGDMEQIQKIINYDVLNDIAAENYISDQIYVGGEVYMDKENEEYSGIEMDPGTFVQSTTTISGYSASRIKVMGVGDEGLIGGFFSALPSIKTVKTPKGEMSLSEALTSIMASEIYDIDISNAEPNKSFTLTLKYDKEKAIENTNSLKIYQYNDESKQWEKVNGTYTVDPMLGTVSVEIPSFKISETNNDTVTPFGRKKLGMSAVVNGRFVPQGTTSSQTGRFAVFTAMPPTGTSYEGSSFEIYNIPNPFNLKPKTVPMSTDVGSSGVTGKTEGTIIKYHLPSGKSGNIKLVIYNIAGEKVRTLDEGYRNGGQIYYSEWDGRNDKNEKCASGVYFLVAYLNGDKIGKPHKMAIIK
ncbi:MAG: carboxypeptidase regulatory-like domain-containing protein [Elusimicrobiota bacterium]